MMLQEAKLIARHIGLTRINDLPIDLNAVRREQED
jgi:hypothetical protein